MNPNLEGHFPDATDEDENALIPPELDEALTAVRDHADATSESLKAQALARVISETLGIENMVVTNIMVAYLNSIIRTAQHPDSDRYAAELFEEIVRTLEDNYSGDDPQEFGKELADLYESKPAFIEAVVALAKSLAEESN